MGCVGSSIRSTDASGGSIRASVASRPGALQNSCSCARRFPHVVRDHCGDRFVHTRIDTARARAVAALRRGSCARAGGLRRGLEITRADLARLLEQQSRAAPAARRVLAVAVGWTRARRRSPQPLPRRRGAYRCAVPLYRSILFQTSTAPTASRRTARTASASSALAAATSATMAGPASTTSASAASTSESGHLRSSPSGGDAASAVADRRPSAVERRSGEAAEPRVRQRLREQARPEAAGALARVAPAAVGRAAAEALLAADRAQPEPLCDSLQTTFVHGRFVNHASGTPSR